MRHKKTAAAQHDTHTPHGEMCHYNERANLNDATQIKGKLVPAPLILNHGARWGEPLRH